MTLIGHLTELRDRLVVSIIALVVGTAIAWPLYGRVFRILEGPFCDFMRTNRQLAFNPQNPCKLVFSSVTEPFVIKLKLVVYVGFLLALPVILYELWRFITPGLTSRERRYAAPFVFASVGLFALGAWFGMVTLPKALQFLLGFAGSQGVTAVLSIGKYLSFVTLVTLAFGASFEFPVVLISLTLVGVLSSRKLRQWRRYGYLSIAVVAAVITPSQDWFTMSAMMVPLLVFYELSILISRLLKK